MERLVDGKLAAVHLTKNLDEKIEAFKAKHKLKNADALRLLLSAGLPLSGFAEDLLAGLGKKLNITRERLLEGIVLYYFAVGRAREEAALPRLRFPEFSATPEGPLRGRELFEDLLAVEREHLTQAFRRQVGS